MVKYLHSFKPYNLLLKNTLNHTRIISNILYEFPEVKKLWLEKLEGLVVCDSTGWIDSAIKELEHSQSIILWWDKNPTGGKQV